MSRVSEFIELVESFEGDDKLGYLDRLDLDFKHQVNYDYDRYGRDKSEEERLSTSEDIYYQVSVEYSKSRTKYGKSARIQTRKHRKSESCYLELQELLKLEVEKKKILSKISNGDVQKDNVEKVVEVKEKSLDELQKELKDAISVENYKLARDIQNKIDERERHKS